MQCVGNGPKLLDHPSGDGFGFFVIEQSNGAGLYFTTNGEGQFPPNPLRKEITFCYSESIGGSSGSLWRYDGGANEGGSLAGEDPNANLPTTRSVPLTLFSGLHTGSESPPVGMTLHSFEIRARQTCDDQPCGAGRFLFAGEPIKHILVIISEIPSAQVWLVHSLRPAVITIAEDPCLPNLLVPPAGVGPSRSAPTSSRTTKAASSLARPSSSVRSDAVTTPPACPSTSYTTALAQVLVGFSRRLE